MFVHLVVAAWLYVALMMAVVEAFSSQGSVLGAVFTFLGYGVLPLAIVVYILRTPARKRALRRRASADDDDGGRHAAGAAITPEREEP